MRKFDISRVNIYTIFRDLIVNSWIIVLAAITGFVGSVCYYNYLHKHSYVSSMMVSINLSGYTQDATALSLARTVAIAETLDDVFQSEALCDVVTHDLGEEITGTISASQLEETNLVRISVTDKTPQKAYETLVSVYNNYPKVTDFVFNNVIIRTIINPSMPTSPAGAISPKLLGVLCGFLAAAIVTAFIVLVSFLRDTIKNPSDVDKELNIKLFGIVNRVKGMSSKLPQAKRRLIITNPLIGFDFANSFRRMAVKLESLRRTKGHKTFMITSITENEGKTSATVNLGVALAQNGYKVLILDCDLKNPSVYRFFDGIEHPEELDFHKYLDNGGDIRQFIKHDTATDVKLLCSAKFCTHSAEKISSLRFAEVMRELKGMFDFIIVDTPPCGITIDAEIISGTVDAALMVVRQDVVTVTDINDQLENLNKCYLAGCIFNDVISFKTSNNESYSDYNVYYTRQNG